MKKTYIIPELTAVYTAQTLLQSASEQIQGGGDASLHLNQGVVGDVKGNSQSYNVWSDDWSK